LFWSGGFAMELREELLWLLTRVGASENAVWDLGISDPKGFGELRPPIADCGLSKTECLLLIAD
jgi:hypothetical protein